MPPGCSAMDAKEQEAANAAVDERQVDAALRALAWESLGPAAAGLSALFAVFAVAHLFTLPAGGREMMSALATLTSAALALVVVAWRLRKIPHSHAHAWGAAVGLLVLANCLVHLQLSRDLQQTTNLVLLV